jgi:NADPH:quinone reductase-like Zn-dependent oxidoreductase
VNGASGAVGVAAIQLAKHFGAEVTGVCSGANLELVRELGADHVLDYTQEDFTENGKKYDIIVDTAGTAPYSRSKDSLQEDGRLLLVLAALPDILPMPWVALTTNKRIIAGPAAERADDVRLLAKLAETGELKPVIDRRYPLERIADAHRYVDAGHKKGSVVVTLGG